MTDPQVNEAKSLIDKYFTKDEQKDIVNVRDFSIKFYNFLALESQVQDKYKDTHKGFLETLKNEHIWVNYFNALLLRQPMLLIPTYMPDIIKYSDYFTEESAENFETYTTALIKLVQRPGYVKVVQMGCVSLIDRGLAEKLKN